MVENDLFYVPTLVCNLDEDWLRETGMIDLHTKKDVEETFSLLSYPNYADLRDATAEAVEIAGFFGGPEKLREAVGRLQSVLYAA